MDRLDRRIKALERHVEAAQRPLSEWTTGELEAYTAEFLGLDRPPTDDELRSFLANETEARK